MTASDARPYGASVPAGTTASRLVDHHDHTHFIGQTQHPAGEGKIYCCVVLDAFSRFVVGWSIDFTQTTTLVLNALGMAIRRRTGNDGLVIHSDRGV